MWFNAGGTPPLDRFSSQLGKISPRRVIELYSHRADDIRSAAVARV
jgi:hypothetical protein